MNREEISFRSGDADIAAWLYRPEGESEGDVPCVVMAHGFSLNRHDGLDLYAKRFADAGLAVLVFDHRYLGDSGGEPRQRFRKAEQLADWERAIAFAQALDGVDPYRTILWGYSFSGGHVATLAPRTAGLAAALVLCPFVNGLGRVLKTKPGDVAWLFPRAIGDWLGRANTVPVTTQPGEHGAMNLPGEADGFARAVPPGSPWRNEISPAVFATIAFHRPLRLAGRTAAPLWVGLCERDITVHKSSVERYAERAPKGELHRYDGDHFDPFIEPLAGEIVASQVEFLAGQGLARTASPA